MKQRDRKSKKGKEAWLSGWKPNAISINQGTFSVKQSSEQRSDMDLEPTVTFLFTLLNTSEHKDSET